MNQMLEKTTSAVTRMHLLAQRIRGSMLAGSGIPEDALNELLVGVHIVDLIGERVPLTKAGREYQALCPFHEEQSPSFTVSSLKQYYHCFGCGAHGTALAFLQRFEGLSLQEAVIALLAAYAGVTREFAASVWLGAHTAPPPPPKPAPAATATPIR